MKRHYWKTGRLTLIIVGLSVILGCSTAGRDASQRIVPCSEHFSSQTGEYIQLRAIPTVVSPAQVAQMIREHGFYERIWQPQTDVLNVYTTLEMDGDVVVVDCAHQLMWATGVVVQATFENAAEVMATMHYAGFNDWRMPTIAELSSVLEAPHKTTYAYHPAFSNFVQAGAWSADETLEPPSNTAWAVRFDRGVITILSQNTFFYLLPVRDRRPPPFDSKTGASIRGLPKDW
jgi:hypothetical protein